MADFSLGANAPYNFIPLPEKVREFENPPGHDCYQPGLLSGYFDCVLTTLSPLYIRSTLTLKEYQKRANGAEKKRASDDKPDFFSPGGELRIPGSSLRGMARMLVEILSSSALQAISHQQMFFRGVGDTRKFPHSAAYIQRLTEENELGKRYNSSRAGCIVKEGATYWLYESRRAGSGNGRSKFRVDPATIIRTLKLPIISEQLNWKRERIWFNPLTLDRGSVRDFKLRSSGPQPAGWEAGWLIVPGKAPPPRGKDGKPGIKRHWIITEPDYTQDPLRVIPVDEVLDYRDGGGLTQASSNNKFSVLPERDGVENARPCFFTLWDEEDGKTDQEKRHVNFGHTAYFRLPYKTRPKDLVPEQIRKGADGPSDMAEGIFGTAAGSGGKAGRVYFEDARPDPPEQANPLLALQYPRILSSPKPTSYQHYLEQPEAARAFMQRGQSQNWAGALQFWDDGKNPQIRGHKLYWHRNPENWYEAQPQPSSSQHTQIKAVREGITFRFRVRFDNLRPEELGALATGLFLPEGMAHKLGMGKPLGLGSVRIEGSLNLVDRKARYSNLFSTDGESWQSGVAEAVDPAKYGQTFAGWLWKDNPNPPASLWEDKRLSELKYMLTYQGRPADWQDRTRYMDVKEYQNRFILLSPHEVWKGEADFREIPPVAGPAQIRTGQGQAAYNPNYNNNRPGYRPLPRGDRDRPEDGGRVGTGVTQPSAPPLFPPNISNILRQIQGIDKKKARGEVGRILNLIKPVTVLAHQKKLASDLLKRIKDLDLLAEPILQPKILELQEIIDRPE